MDVRSFNIIASNKASVEKQIEKLNKRARKIGLEEITIKFGKAFVGTIAVLVKKGDAPAYFEDRDALLIPTELTGTLCVKYDGWQFVATIQHLDTGENLLRKIVEIELPEIYRKVDNHCDHCKSDRNRKDTYIIKHNDGRFAQIGSTCLKLFLDGYCPDNLLNAASFVKDVVSFMEESERCDSGGHSSYYLQRFLTCAAMYVDKFGYVSKAKSETNNVVTTAEEVLEHLADNPNFEYDQQYVETAGTVIDWVENLSDDECNNDYLYNLRAIARTGYVERRTAGYAASMIAAYNNDKARKEIAVNSKHVGVIGKRCEFELKLKKHIAFDSTYGTIHRYIFADTDGNVLTWKASNRQQMEEGNVYKVKGTVKKHEVYKDVPQTILSRCIVL